MSIAALQRARAAPGALTMVTRSTMRTLETSDGPVAIAIESVETLAHAAGVDVQTYTLARMLASEGYGGDKTVGAAAAAVVQAQVLFRAAGGADNLVDKLLASKYLGARGRYGSQKGRYASTRQDPTRWHVKVAREVLRGGLRDLSRGATNFLDPTAFGDRAEYERVLTSWTRTRRWVGPIASIASAHFQAFAPSDDAALRAASRADALVASRDESPAPGNPDGGGGAGGLAVAALAAAALWLVL